MGSAIDITQSSELLQITRNAVIESRHYGVAVVLDPAGEVLEALGDPEALIFPRSALKPFQAIGSLRAGAVLETAQLALACASHLGTEQHQLLARSMLDSVELGEEHLQCPSSWPGDSATRSAMAARGQRQNKLAFNCSGKHAAFLAASVASGESVDTYLSAEHPVQLSAYRAMEEFCGPISFLGVDGCGAPAPQMSLKSLAEGFRKLATSAEPAARSVSSAMREHPWAVRGTGSPNTIVIESTGIIAKLGAEGVLGMSAPNGVSVAIKILDGASRGIDVLALQLLATHGVLSPQKLEELTSALMPAGSTAGTRAAGVSYVGRDFDAR
ncbi:asparaginase [Glutamicibacter arilaitensis]|uniref:asparaginase n=1 Tax=Glutamicibacter arilaitensis TaxID=256701 RepID=UPI00384CA45B